MKSRIPRLRDVVALGVLVAMMSCTGTAIGQQPANLEAAVANPSDAALTTDVGGPGTTPLSSVEQGQTPLTESFETDRQWRLEKRREAIRDTQFKANLRAYYFGRDNADGTEDESMAIGGWLGLKTGYFLDHIAIGATGYTAQHLAGAEDKDGANLLRPGQEGYTVLGELYVDIRIMDDLNLYVGRKEFDTPYLNGHDNRMTPNTFEAIVLQGKTKLGNEGATLKYGAGYFDAIKERNSSDFVSMSEDAGADVDRGVFSAGALYQKGDFSIGAIDYYCPDIINIGYGEVKLGVPIGNDLKPTFALQFTDQRSVGDEMLKDEGFSVQQFGIQAELPVGHALFTTAYTHNTDGADVDTSWAGYPGYTSSQVEDYNRAGEGAFLIRAGYEFPWVEGLSAYAMFVHGSDPEGAEEFPKDECNFNVQWGPTKGALKGLSLRVRYAIVEQDGGDADRVNEIRVICNYGVTF